MYFQEEPQNNSILAEARIQKWACIPAFAGMDLLIILSLRGEKATNLKLMGITSHVLMGKIAMQSFSLTVGKMYKYHFRLPRSPGDLAKTLGEGEILPSSLLRKEEDSAIAQFYLFLQTEFLGGLAQTFHRAGQSAVVDTVRDTEMSRSAKTHARYG